MVSVLARHQHSGQHHRLASPLLQVFIIIIFFETSIGFAPLSLPSLAQWFDGADPFGNGTSVANGTNLAVWVDKSTSGINFVQPAAANQPSANIDSSGYATVLFSAAEHVCAAGSRWQDVVCSDG